METSNVISKAILGVDPGVRGGLALLNPTGSVGGVWSIRPDMSEQELVDLIFDPLNRPAGLPVCYFEKVGYMPTDGGKGAFTFGKIVGLLRGILLAEGVRIFDISPMMWQSSMGCLTGGNKNITKRLAQELFPDIKMTHAIADALLIAEYGRRRLTL